MSVDYSSCVMSTSKLVIKGSFRSNESHLNTTLPRGELPMSDEERIRIEYEAKELSEAFSLYKLVHRRCFLSFEEVIQILRFLGYARSDECGTRP